MTRNDKSLPAETSSTAQTRKRIAGTIFALVYPAIITWAYFVLAGRHSTGAQQTVFLAVKVCQFAFPLIWVGWVLREPLRTGRASWNGLFLGAAFSVCVVAAGWSLFAFVLRDAPVFANASQLILKKVQGFGINSLAKYAVLAVFYSLVHSLLEEYYWRWFVFQQLRCLIPRWPAIVVSALGFMAHHVIVLVAFFEGAPALAWALSLAVAMGGAFWAWLYERTGSIFGPWLSHLIIDAGIFWIGYELLGRTISS
jgi:membrane protease YdiL (CAAX protease family)